MQKAKKKFFVSLKKILLPKEAIIQHSGLFFCSPTCVL